MGVVARGVVARGCSAGLAAPRGEATLTLSLTRTLGPLHHAALCYLVNTPLVPCLPPLAARP